MVTKKLPASFFKPLISGLFFMLLLSGSVAQELTAPKQEGYWITYSGDHRINDRLGIMSLISLRNYFLKERVEQTLARVGLNYYFNSRTILTAGYGFMYADPDEFVARSDIREHQIWQQFITRHRTRAIFWEHRYRLEQRFLSNLNSSTSRLDYRVRYRFQFILPFYSISPHLRHFFFAANDEIFLNLNPAATAGVFDRNRIFLALGYQVSPKFNLRLGYLNQIANSASTPQGEVNHLVQLGISYNMEDIMHTFFNRSRK